MKKKKLAALAMAGVVSMSMSVSVFAVDSDTEGKASGETNIGGEVNNSTRTEAYVMTIPAGNTNMDLTSTDAQEIGNLKVTRTEADAKANKSFKTDKKVSVDITSENNGKLKNTDGNDTLAYTLKVGSDSVASGSDIPTQYFSASDIDDENDVAMTATITGDSTKVANGTYQDKLTFSASVADAATAWNGEYTLTSSRANGKVLKAAEILAADSDTFTYNSVTYTAYNGYIKETSSANWNDAKAFVTSLNEANYDGHNDWCLLSSKEMATAWWQNGGGSSARRGSVNFLFSSNEKSGDQVYYFSCSTAENEDFGVAYAWSNTYKTVGNSDYGFVLLRGSAS